MNRTALSLAAAGGLLLPWFITAQTQDPEEGTRQLWNSQFFQKRPEGKAPSAAPPKNIVYKPVAQAKAAPPRPAGSGIIDTLLGVTLWRLRSPRPADDPNSRLLVIEEDNTSNSDLVPERVDIDTPLNEGDRVRLTVEVPRSGYLYVIDRETYADGTSSAAYLIYPNYKTRAGDNSVAAGRIVEVPDQRDTPNHFRLRRSKPDQTAEILTMLITPDPLPNLTITRKPLALPEELYAEWEKKYGVQAERFDLAGGLGTAYTGAEKKAGGDGQARMTKDDPMPQTLYRVPAPEGRAILLSVPVKLKR